MELLAGISLAAIEQWGTNTIGSRTTRTEAYPLPYSEFCLPIVSGKGYVGGLNYGFGVGVTNFGLTSVTIANNSEDSSYRWTGYTYIVVGAQPQWGINSAGNNGSEGESGWYAFPVNFNSACFALFCGLRNTDTNNPTNYDSEVQPRNWTTTKFNVYKQNYGGNPWFGSFIWLAIGRQPASYKL